jgi:hypothetical protein
MLDLLLAGASAGCSACNTCVAAAFRTSRASRGRRSALPRGIFGHKAFAPAGVTLRRAPGADARRAQPSQRLPLLEVSPAGARVAPRRPATLRPASGPPSARCAARLPAARRLDARQACRDAPGAAAGRGGLPRGAAAGCRAVCGDPLALPRRGAAPAGAPRPPRGGTPPPAAAVCARGSSACAHAKLRPPCARVRFLCLRFMNKPSRTRLSCPLDTDVARRACCARC